MVSALVGGRWFRSLHGLYCRVVSLEKKLLFHIFSFTQVYKWVPAIIMLGGNLAMDKYPIQGGVAIFLSSGRMNHLACKQVYLVLTWTDLVTVC